MTTATLSTVDITIAEAYVRGRQLTRSLLRQLDRVPMTHADGQRDVAESAGFLRPYQLHGRLNVTRYPKRDGVMSEVLATDRRGRPFVLVWHAHCSYCRPDLPVVRFAECANRWWADRDTLDGLPLLIVGGR